MVCSLLYQGETVEVGDYSSVQLFRVLVPRTQLVAPGLLPPLPPPPPQATSDRERRIIEKAYILEFMQIPFE